MWNVFFFAEILNFGYCPVSNDHMIVIFFRNVAATVSKSDTELQGVGLISEDSDLSSFQFGSRESFILISLTLIKTQREKNPLHHCLLIAIREIWKFSQ